MIEIKNITRSYTMGDHVMTVLDDVSLKIQRGDFVAIMGPSGSGKSTLMNILGLLDIPNSGKYFLEEKEVSGLSEDELAIIRREFLGFIFQQFHLLPRMSAVENVAVPLLYSEKKLDLSKAKVLLEKVGLGQRLAHKMNELSGGQQQRVAIARSLINEPLLILADEPTGNLDSKSTAEIMNILHELNDQGMTVIMVTHEEEIGHQAKRLIRMRDGVVQSDERLKPLGETKKAQRKKIKVSEQSLWMDSLEYSRQGLKTLLANKIRSGLSMLGILIGVAAVVAMLAVGTGARKVIESQLSSLGSNLLVLRTGSIRHGGVSGESGAVAKITLDDVSELKRLIPEIVKISPNVDGKGQVTYQNKNLSTQVQGATPLITEIKKLDVEVGRFFNDQENQKRERVAILGATVAQKLFESTGPDFSPIGEYIKINKVNFQVIGVLPVKGSTGFRDMDDIIYVPLSTAMYRLLGKNYLDTVEIEVGKIEDMVMVEERISEIMIERHHVPPSQIEDAFRIRNMAEIQAAFTESSKTMSVLLATIAAISLVVGGIGIMNIMLVSVTERTREIGLRKAIGAKRSDILLQFLAESMVVSVVGGLLGIAIGWSVSMVISMVTGWVTSISPISIILAFCFSAGIGIIFGIYPARKASMLNPIESLRYE